MTKEDNKVGWDFCLNKISQHKFIELFSYDVINEPEGIYKLLESAYRHRNKDEVELILILARVFNTIDRSYVPLLCQLLEVDFHFKHEDIASSLQHFADPRSVDALYATAIRKFDYLAYDNSYALARKCIWALGSINSNEAKDRLLRINDVGDKEIKSYVEEQWKRNGI